MLKTDDSPEAAAHDPKGDLPTNYLHSDQAEPGRPAQPTIDWLRTLAPPPTVTEPLPPEPPESSGMSAHASPPRMAPTLGARVRSGFRRAFLLFSVSIVAVSALAAGAYALSETSWLSGLFAPPVQTAPQTSEPSNQPQPGQPGTQPQSPIEAPAGDGTESAATLRDRGIEQYKAGNFAEAIDLFERSITLDGGDAITYYQLGLAYMAVTGREHALDDAELAFRTAIALEPEWGAAHSGLAESLLRRGFYAQAIPPALEATRLDPNLAEAWLTLARAYEGNRQPAEATAAYAQAARLSPPPQP